jgi:hypothetical protein
MNSNSIIDLAKLKRLRRNHYLVFSVAGLSVLLWIGGGLLSLFLPPEFARLCGMVSAAGFVILAVIILFSFWFRRTRCPRCRKPFYVSEGVLGFFQKTIT